jgi:hypothetical protein
MDVNACVPGGECSQRLLFAVCCLLFAVCCLLAESRPSGRHGRHSCCKLVVPAQFLDFLLRRRPSPMACRQAPHVSQLFNHQTTSNWTHPRPVRIHRPGQPCKLATLRPRPLCSAVKWFPPPGLLRPRLPAAAPGPLHEAAHAANCFFACIVPIGTTAPCPTSPTSVRPGSNCPTASIPSCSVRVLRHGQPLRPTLAQSHYQTRCASGSHAHP